MIARAFLGLQALLFIPYGLYCLVDPGMLAGAAGVSATSMTGTIELQAMYGGLQVAVGVLCLMGLFRKHLEQVALYTLLFIFAGLAVVRVSLGLMHGDFSSYTVFAMSYEAFCLLFLSWRLLLRPAPTPSPSS
ncbi:MAG: DUF4345 family protein [Halieaceae bacterium]|jgi:hypothetical protein|nr:DUF4345 family protein [Halieaceae bacterium]